MATYYGLLTDAGSTGGDTVSLVATVPPGTAATVVTVKVHKSGAPPFTTTMTTNANGFASVTLTPDTYTQLVEVSASPTLAVSMIQQASPQGSYTQFPPEAKTKGTLFYATSNSIATSVLCGNPATSGNANVTITGPSGVITSFSVLPKMATRYELGTPSLAIKVTSSASIVLETGVYGAAGLNLLLPS
jgi:hypothetical protein